MLVHSELRVTHASTLCINKFHEKPNIQATDQPQKKEEEKKPPFHNLESMLSADIPKVCTEKKSNSL